MKKMFHPRLGTMHLVADEHVEHWKSQGWRMSPPKGHKHSEPKAEHHTETPQARQADRDTETPDPVPPPDAA